MANKISLNEELKAMDLKDPDWYNNLSDSDRKEISLWILMRYMSSCESKNLDLVIHHLLLTNECVNVHFSHMSKYPALQFRLLQVVGTNKSQNHKWIKPPIKAKKNKLAEWLSEIFIHYNDEEIELLISENSTETLKEFAKSYGMQDKELTALFKK